MWQRPSSMASENSKISSPKTAHFWRTWDILLFPEVVFDFALQTASSVSNADISFLHARSVDIKSGLFSERQLRILLLGTTHTSGKKFLVLGSYDLPIGKYTIHGGINITIKTRLVSRGRRSYSVGPFTNVQVEKSYVLFTILLDHADRVETMDKGLYSL